MRGSMKRQTTTINIMLLHHDERLAKIETSMENRMENKMEEKK